MAFVPGLSKSQVVKVIENYADLAPATMQIIDDLSAQINDPNDPAAALIARMTVAESDIDLNESSISTLSGIVSGKQDAVSGVSATEIGYLDGVTSSIQNQIDSKAPSSNPTLSNPTLTGTITLPNASIANSKLTNSSISINGTSVPLGGQVTVTGTALPSQADNAGKALVTDGSTLSWETVDVSNLIDPTISVSPHAPELVSSVTGVSIGANLAPGETSYLELSDEASSAWAHSLPSNMSNGYYDIEVASEWPAGPQYLRLKVLYRSMAYAYPRLYVEYDGGHYTAPSGWLVDLYVYDGTPIEILPDEISYLDGVTSNLQTQINSITSITNNIKFDSVVITPSLDNTAVISLDDGAITYYQENDTNTAGITVELVGDRPGGLYTQLNSVMTVGQAATFVLMIKNGSTASYPSSVLVPYSGVATVRWQGGTAPTSGNLNAVDIYTFTVIKIANNEFDVFADVAKFA